MNNAMRGKLNTSYITCLLFTLFIFSSAQAARFDQSVVSIMAGTSFTSPGENQTISLIPPLTNTYVDKSATQVRPVAGLFVGGRMNFQKNYILQLGVAGYLSQRQKLQGVVWQFSDPDFDNLNYAYLLRSERVMLQTELMFKYHEHLLPYVSAGIGLAWNKAYNYSESPRNDTAVPAPAFSDHTLRSLAYSLGAGINYRFKQHWEIGLAYQYVNSGNLRLGAASVQAEPDIQYLRGGKLHSNEILAKLTYVF